MSNFDSKYRRKQLKVIQDMEDLYDELVDEILPSIASIRLVEKEYFQFKNYKSAEKKIDKMIRNISVGLNSYIRNQCKNVWELSNTKNDALVVKIYVGRNKTVPAEFKQANTDKLNVFLDRKVKDLNISSRVWNLNAGYKSEIESAINAALRDGQSAQNLAREIKKYLNNPEARFRKVRDKFGKLAPSKSALSYQPGQGVYRSAKQNALRLARNEINNAYRLADWERWQQLPFVVGFKIKNSDRENTVCSVCKEYDGKVFPKTYKFLGFHVQCMCTALPEMAKEPLLTRILNGESVELEYPPMPASNQISI